MREDTFSLANSSSPVSFIYIDQITNNKLASRGFWKHQDLCVVVSGPNPNLALSTPPPFVCSRGGSATFRVVPNQVVRSVIALSNPHVASLHCKLTAVLKGSAIGKWRKKNNTQMEVQFFWFVQWIYFTRTFVTLTNKITTTVEIQTCCSSDRQLT